jgi:hypothetical protein
VTKPTVTENIRKMDDDLAIPADSSRGLAISEREAVDINEIALAYGESSASGSTLRAAAVRTERRSGIQPCSSSRPRSRKPTGEVKCPGAIKRQRRPLMPAHVEFFLVELRNRLGAQPLRGGVPRPLARARV